MKRFVVGILAHVDSGKTTLSEAMLYRTGTIRSLGRVDHGDSFLDSQEFKNYEEFKKMSSQFDEEKVLSGEFINHYQDLNPDFWLVYYQAGKYYFNQKDYQKAKIEFEKALKKEITTVPDKGNVEKYLKKTLRKLK